MSDMVKLTIDGHPVEVPKKTLLVEAARKLGIEIPVYCYHPKLDPMGACRVCAVEVEGQRRPIMTACTTEATEGMVVHTRSPNAIKARTGILEFLLINHPLDCPVCDRGGECDLQDFTLRYGPPKSRFLENKRHFQKSILIGPEVVLDRERCIMCMRCVRFCDEVALEEGLSVIERGDRSEVGPFEGKPFDSQFSGNTVEICPVGALTSRSYRFRARPWELQHFAGVCNHCPMGCNLTVDVRYEDVVRFRARANDDIDDGWLCDRGRYGYKFINREDRLRHPLVRQGGELKQASWEEALKAAAAGFEKVEPKDRGAVAGPRLGNEAAWALARLVRSLWGSPHLDHPHGTLWKGPTARIAGLDQATAVVVVDCDPTTEAPVLDLRIKKTLRRGAGLVVVSNRETGLDRYADIRLQGDLSELICALQNLEPPQPPAGLRHPAPRPWQAGGTSSQDLTEARRLLAGSPRVTFVCHEDHCPPDLLEALRALIEAVGAQAPYGLLPMVRGANSRGLREMGVLPDVGPGWLALAECGSLWDGFCTQTGKDYRSILTDSRGLLVMADDPFQDGGTRPEHLVVCDLFLTETARLADVVLPASSMVEQTLTMTAMDGTVQLGRQAIPPVGASRPDLWILTALAEAMGQKWTETAPRDVFAQLGRHNPLYQGGSYAHFIPAGERHWSYPQMGRLGTPRPDLSAMPVRSQDGPPWVESVAMDTTVERVARIRHGDVAPAVPGQRDPRRVAAALSFQRALEAAPPPPAEPGEGEDRVLHDTRAPQPPGPGPAYRYHTFGMAARALPPTADPKREESAGEEAP